MYTQINKNLYLVSEKFQRRNQKEVQVRQRVNHILIVDASGSMYGTMQRLIQDVINQIANFDKNDTLTIGWFSSKGEFGWIVKGMSVQEEAAITNTLRNHDWAFNMTCFSDILADVENVINDLTPLSNNFSCLFFSDGQVNQDAKAIKGILTKLAPKLSVSTFVGYGDWYGRDQMADMASTTGGTFVHSSTLNDFSRHFSNYRDANQNSESKIELKGKFNDRQFMIAVTETGEVISFDMESSNFYVPANTDKIVYLSSKTDKTKVDPDQMQSEVYAISRAALQAGQYNLALDILGTIGDVQFIDKINNSFTVSEYGTVENALLEAVTNETFRFTNGKKPNYVPKADQFCMLNLIDLLTSDDEPDAVFLPYHPAFEYKKIGRSSKQKDGYPTFNAAQDVEVPLNKVVWNSEKFNLGVLAKIPGTIQLDKDAGKHGLDQLFQTFIWRNYAIVFDGKLNVLKLPIRGITENTLELLDKNGLVESAVNGTVVLDLTQIPIINRKIAEQYKNLTEVCDLLAWEKLLEVENKVFNSLFKKLPENVQEQIENIVKSVKFTDEQIAYLDGFGVKKDGSFGPPTERAKATDFLPVKEFKFGIKGLNSIPKVDEVIEKVGKNKTLTPIQTLVFNAHERFLTTNVSKTETEKALWIKETLEEGRKALSGIRSKLNEAKFAVVLGKANFNELPVLQEHNEYPYDGNIFTIDIKDSKVEI